MNSSLKQKLILIFLVISVIISIIYIKRHDTNSEIEKKAVEISSNKIQINSLLDKMDSIWNTTEGISHIYLELHEKKEYASYFIYNNRKLITEIRDTNLSFYTNLKANDIITVLKYNKEFLILNRIASNYKNEKFSLILFLKMQQENNSKQIIYNKYKNVISIKRIETGWYLFSQK